MRLYKLFCGCLPLIFAAAVLAQSAVPPGTILPVRLDSSISAKMPANQPITARVMQDVASPSGNIRSGARVTGHVVSVVPPSDREGPRITFVFDKIVVGRRVTPVLTDLRAMASFVEVNDTQIPEAGADRGTPESARTLTLIGGDVDYRGGGPVMEAGNVVGMPTAAGVLSRVKAEIGLGCRGTVGAADRTQSLWVFSAAACGLYGLPGLSIGHAGRTAPLGQVILASTDGQLKISAGAGLLLRVVAKDERVD